MFENVRFYAEMPILGLERCDIFENPDDLDGMRCLANRRRKKNTRMPCGGIPRRLVARGADVQILFERNGQRG